ncbi:MAG TPA: transcriptional regulator, partial [Pyrinomonadaceae bacterium]|nr:transcriptional regulator [Pyrinomonadaceae bacterium]
MNREANNLYVFGEFRLDPAEQVLRRGTQPVPLAPRVFETLRILVERHGHVVSKTELIDAVWADTFVEESNLTQNIYTLRRILRTDDNESNLIETVPRRGYRFAAVVTIVERTDGGPEPFRDAYAVPDRESDPYEIEPRNEAKIPASRPSSLPMLGLGIAVLLLGTIALAGVAFFYPGDAGRSATPIEKVNFQKLTFTGDLTFPALAPNGNSFASVRGEQIVVQDIPSGEEMRITVEGH